MCRRTIFAGWLLLASGVTAEDRFQDLIEATVVPAVSPALEGATGDDVVARVRTVDPVDTVAVVLSPRSGGPTVEIPAWPFDRPRDDARRFLQDWFDVAAKTGAGRIQFPADETFLVTPKTRRGRHLKLDGLRDCVVDLNGSTLRLSRVSPGLVVRDCQRLSIRNGTIIGGGVIASVGRVARVSPTVRIEVLAAWRERLERAFRPIRPPLRTVGDIERADGETGWRLPASNYTELFVNRGGDTPSFVYRRGGYECDDALPDDAPEYVVGDHVWLQHENNAGHAIFLDNRDGDGLHDITLGDLTLINVPGMAVAGSVRRGLLMRRVRTAAADGEPFAVASDTVHLNSIAGDVVIRECDFGPSLDDKINIKGNWWRIDDADPESRTVTVVPAGRKTSVRRWGSAGDAVVLIDEDLTVIAEAELTSKAFRENGKRHRLTLRPWPPSDPVGRRIANATTAGGRIVIQGNTFGDTRAQGVVVQTSHVSIVDNTFRRNAGPPIDIRFDHSGWFESIAPRNIRVADNRFESCGGAVAKPNGPIRILQREPVVGEIVVVRDLDLQREVGGNAPPSADQSRGDSETLTSPTAAATGASVPSVASPSASSTTPAASSTGSPESSVPPTPSG